MVRALPHLCLKCEKEIISGRRIYCNACYKERFNKYYRKWYKKNGRKRTELQKQVSDEWQRSYPFAVKAKWKVKQAIEKGLIKKANRCEICGSKGKIEAHHSDYRKPIDVNWLCKSCHKKLHIEKRKLR